MPSFFTRSRSALDAAWRSWAGESASSAIVAAPEQRAAALSPSASVSSMASPERNQAVLGAGMTPAAVANALMRADRGMMRALSDLLSEQRQKITHMHATLQTREIALTGCEWAIVPRAVTGTRAMGHAQEAAEYVHSRYLEIRNLSNAIAWLAGANFYGRSGLEIFWKRDNRGLGVEELVGIHPRRLSYGPGWKLHLYDEQGNMQEPRLGVYPGVPLAEFPNKFLTWEPITTGCEYPTRQGLGRTLVYMGMFWTWNTRQWYEFAELFGKPWRIGSFERLLDSNDILGLERALAQLGGVSYAVLPVGAKAELLQPKEGGKIHEASRIAQNAEISKVILGQTSTTELGDVGSYASVKVHKLVEESRLTGDGRGVDGVLTYGLNYSMIAGTFGREHADKYTPGTKILTQPDADLNDECTRVMALVDHGATIDMDEARERYSSMSKPEKGAMILVPAALISAQATQNDDGGNGGDGAPKKPADGEQDGPPQDEKKAA